jgi:hypothetical protein
MKKKIYNILKLCKLISGILNEEINQDELQCNIGPNITNNNNRYIPPHFIWFFNHFIGRNFMQYLNNVYTNVDESTSLSVCMVLSLSLTLVLLSYIIYSNKETNIKENDNDDNDDDI